jgi:hypothetical protein
VAARPVSASPSGNIQFNIRDEARPGQLLIAIYIGKSWKVIANYGGCITSIPGGSIKNL